MKQKFSTKWIGSKQPRKQRKFRANAPLHIRRDLMAANLNKDLRKKYGKRSFPLRKEDKVKIMRGEFKGKSGKITIVDNKNYRVVIEGLQRGKKDGSKVNVFFNPSNVQITELYLEDVKRNKALERKSSNVKSNEEKSKTEKSKEQHTSKINKVKQEEKK